MSISYIQLQVKTVFMWHRMKRQNNAEDKGKQIFNKFYDILKGPLRKLIAKRTTLDEVRFSIWLFPVVPSCIAERLFGENLKVLEMKLLLKF